MNHSVSQIGQERQQLSQARMEAPYFSAKGFVQFADNNRDKYCITETDGELYVNTWNVDALVADYKDALNVASGKVKKEFSIDDYTQMVLKDKSQAKDVAFMIGNNNCLISVINEVAKSDKDTALHMAKYILKLLQK